MGIEFLAFSAGFCTLHGQVALDLLSNLHSLGRAINLSSFRRKPESRLLLTAFWIPAYAGMTDQRLFEKGNLDKTDFEPLEFLFRIPSSLTFFRVEDKRQHDPFLVPVKLVLFQNIPAKPRCNGR